MATKVGEVYAELQLKADQASRDLGNFIKKTKDAGVELAKGELKSKRLGLALRRAGDFARSSGQKIKEAIAIATGAIAAGTTAAALFAVTWSGAVDEVGKSADKFGTTAQELQRLEHAMELSGGEAQNMRDAMKEMTKFIQEAEESGVTPFSKSLFELGLNLDALKGKTRTEQFEILADRLNLVDDAQRNLVLRQRLFGEEAGIQLGNFLKQGSTGIRAMGEEVDKLGGKLSGDALKAAADFNDEGARLKVVWSGVSNLIGETLVPEVTRLLNMFRKWTMANRELIATRLKEFLTEAVKLFRQLVPIIQKAVTFFVAFIDKMGGVEQALKTTIGTLAAFKLAAIAAFGASAPWLAGIALAIVAIDNLASKARKAKEEVDRLANTRTVSKVESGVDAGKITDEELLKTPGGRNILGLKKLRDRFNDEKKRAANRLEQIEFEQNQLIVEASRRSRNFGLSSAQKKKERERVKFETKILSTEKEIERLNDAINKQAAVFIAEREKAQAAEASEQRKRDAEGASGDLTPDEFKEFRQLVELAGKGQASPAQLKRLEQLRSKQGLTIPTAPEGDFFGGGGPSGTQNKPDDQPTPLELVNALTRSGTAASITNLQPTGPGTVINHNNFAVNFSSDIDITLNGGKDIPRDGSMREVVEMLKQTAVDAVHDQVNQAFQIQKQQVIG